MDIFGTSTTSSDSEKNKKSNKVNLENMLNCKWIQKSNIRYNILTSDQKSLLEREFIKKKLKFNKSNVRKLARELNLPYKKSLEYFMSQVNQAGKEIGVTESAIRDIENIQKKIDESWKKYLEGCKKYNM